jgi:hypothetical protein
MKKLIIHNAYWLILFVAICASSCKRSGNFDDFEGMYYVKFKLDGKQVNLDYYGAVALYSEDGGSEVDIEAMATGYGNGALDFYVTLRGGGPEINKQYNELEVSYEATGENGREWIGEHGRITFTEITKRHIRGKFEVDLTTDDSGSEKVAKLTDGEFHLQRLTE